MFMKKKMTKEEEKKKKKEDEDVKEAGKNDKEKQKELTSTLK